MLHLSIARYIADQEHYETYKEILKAMLRFGADRQLINNIGLKPIDILE